VTKKSLSWKFENIYFYMRTVGQLLARLFSPVSFGILIVIFGLSDDGGLSVTVAKSSGVISYRGGRENTVFVVEFIVITGGCIADSDAGSGGGGVVADGAGGGGGGGSVIADGGGGVWDCVGASG